MEHRFHNLLFAALNESGEPSTGLAHAVDFAHMSDATMTLFDAIMPVSRVQRHIRFGDKQADEVDLATFARRGQLQEWAEPYRSRLRMGYRVRSGRRSVEIARQVADAGHDLVIVAPDGSVEDLSVVRRLIRTTPCPLLVLRAPILNGSVVAAVDPDDELPLNIMITNSAYGMASICGRTVHIVHAYEPHGIVMVRSANIVDVTDARIATYVDRVRDAHRRALDELVDQLAIEPPVAAHVDVGSPLDVIARNAVELEASLIVVGAGGHPSMPAMLVGHTAERLVAATSGSILVVKSRNVVQNPGDNDWMEFARQGAIAPAVA